MRNKEKKKFQKLTLAHKAVLFLIVANYSFSYLY